MGVPARGSWAGRASSGSHGHQPRGLRWGPSGGAGGLQLSSTGACLFRLRVSCFTLAWITRWGLCATTFSLKEFQIYSSYPGKSTEPLHTHHMYLPFVLPSRSTVIEA